MSNQSSKPSLINKRGIFMLIIYLLLIYLAAVLGLYLLQNRLIYFPVPAPIQDDLESKFFAVNNQSIQVFIVNPGRQDALLYFGGNAESVANNAALFQTHLADISIYLVNYRGYAESSGSPSEQGFYADALAIYSELNQQHRQISVLGRSLGTGVATYLAAKQQVAKLILVTPYDSVLNLAKRRFPFFPVAILLRDKYDSYSRVKQIEAPTLVILAEHDYVVQRSSSERLIAQFKPQQLNLKIIPDSDHNNISTHLGYVLEIKKFLF